MAFDLFGSPTKCDIRVGYISTETGFVDGISVYEANKYAKVNPGTQFVFRNREKVEHVCADGREAGERGGELF